MIHRRHRMIETASKVKRLVHNSTQRARPASILTVWPLVTMAKEIQAEEQQKYVHPTRICRQGSKSSRSKGTQARVDCPSLVSASMWSRMICQWILYSIGTWRLLRVPKRKRKLTASKKINWSWKVKSLRGPRHYRAKWWSLGKKRWWFRVRITNELIKAEMRSLLLHLSKTSSTE